MFIQTQQWNFLNAVYFCFITLSTIGFGDYVPKTKENEEIGLTEEQTELVRFISSHIIGHICTSFLYLSPIIN